MPMFKKTTDRKAAMFTQLKGTITLPGFLLTEKFGDPLPAVDNKITGEYIFVDEQGNAATIYDWRNRSKGVWTAVQPFTFNVGANSEEVATSFIHWLRKQLGV